MLRQATSGNAEIFALSGKLNPYPDGKLGGIEPSVYADPLKDISVVTRPDEHLKLILKDGKIYKNELGKE